MELRIASAPMGRNITESAGPLGYEFAGFSAADVPSFRSPFACVTAGDQMCISFLDAAVRSAEDMAFVEGLERRVRRGAACPGAPGKLLSTLDRVVGRGGRRRDVAIFSCRLNASGALYATAGHSALLVDRHGCMSTMSDMTLPLGVGPRHAFLSRALPLTASDVLIVYNQMFQKEMDTGSLCAILKENRQSGAIAIRDRIAEQWARSEAALQNCQAAAMFVLKPASPRRHSRHEGAFEVVSRLGRTFACRGQRSYGTVDFDIWAPLPVAEAASTISQVA
jgi:hypothetical protein